MSNLSPPTKDNVIHLASRASPGRKQLVGHLFARHAPALRRFLRGRSVEPEEIEDVVQELFARLLDVDRLEEKMSSATGSSRSYLVTMANNLVVDRVRKRQLRDSYGQAQRDIGAGGTDERSPERIVAAQLELEAMKATIMDMPLHWRVAFVMLRFRNMSYQEIAAHMGVQVKQVDNYIVGAMQRLRKARKKIQAAGERPC